MIKKFVAAIFLALSLSSCVETVIVGSVATTNILMREKTIADSKKDINITSKILKEFSKAGLKVPGNAIDVMVNEQRVLLSGIVSSSSLSKKAQDLAWKVTGVKEVIDEVQIARNKSKLNGFRTYSRDAAITSQIEARALFAQDISLLNTKVNTVNSTVYLLGVAQDNYEIDKITKMVAKTKGVKRVVSHIITISDSRRDA